METISDIIYELNCNAKTKALARRIELARINDEQRWRKDIADTRRLTAERMMEGIELAEKTRCGNCDETLPKRKERTMSSKQREELQRISAAITVSTLSSGVRLVACTMSPEEVKHIVDTILAEPPRNCDKCKNADEAVALAVDAGVVDCNFGAKEMAEFLLAEAKGETND